MEGKLKLKITDYIDISHEDNKLLMRRYPDKYFALAIVDPPYGIDGNSHRKNKSRGKLTMSKDYHTALWDQSVPDDEYFKELFRISKNQIIFGGNYFPQLGNVHKPPRMKDLTEWIKEHPTGWMIWDKVNGKTNFNDVELAWTSFDKPTFIYRFMWNGMMQGSSILNGHIMNGKKELNQKRIHPTEKPIMMYEFILMNYSKQGDINLDTHIGSGSNAIAHEKNQIELIGCEIDGIHFIDCVTRLNNYKSQLEITII